MIHFFDKWLHHLIKNIFFLHPHISYPQICQGTLSAFDGSTHHNDSWDLQQKWVTHCMQN